MQGTYGLKRRLVLAGMMLLSAVPVFARSTQVLILHSYHASEWTDAVSEGMRRTLPAQVSNTFRVEYLDLKYNAPSDEYLNRVKDLYAVKYRKEPVDLILTSGNEALDFVLNTHKDLWNEAPVVFCGTDRLYAAHASTNRLVTGVVDPGSYRETLRLAMKWRPQVNRITVLSGDDPASQGRLTAFMLQVAELAPSVSVEVVKGVPLASLRQRLNKVTPENFIFFLSYWHGRATEHVAPHQLADILRHLDVPVFGQEEWMVGNGVIGGRCVNGLELGAAAGALGAKILAGTPPSSLPVDESAHAVFHFDSSLLMRHRIRPRQLPPDSIQLFEPEPYYALSLQQALFIALVLIALLLLILVLNRNIGHRRKAARALADSEARYRNLFDYSNDAVILHKKGQIMDANAQACSLLGYTRKQLLQLPLDALRVEAGIPGAGAAPPSQRMGRGSVKEAQLLTSSGLVVDVEISTSLADPVSHLAQDIIRDITERKRMDEKVRESQKMRAVGQLAGGIAHDFNNMLGGILGAAELLKFELGNHTEALDDVNTIIDSTHRAADLTSKLLAFSHTGKTALVPVDLHELIEKAILLLRRSIDPRVQIHLELNAQKPYTLAEFSELQNVILNIGLNASDAMPEGGHLLVRTGNIQLSPSDCKERPFDLVAGDFIRIQISDTGSGMNEQTMSRLYEPFFTTKPIGKGTGLGMASVYGSIVSHHGAIEVQSEEGVGSSFILLFRLTDERPAHIAPPPGTLQMGRGCLLVVDDQPAMRDVACGMLRRLGYETLVASNGLEGVSVFRENRGKITAVLLDFAMPVMGGKECFYKLKQIDEHVPVVMTTGYADEAAIEEMMDQGLKNVLRKPYGLADLGDVVSQVLAAAHPASPQKRRF